MLSEAPHEIARHYRSICWVACDGVADGSRRRRASAPPSDCRLQVEHCRIAGPCFRHGWGKAIIDIIELHADIASGHTAPLAAPITIARPMLCFRMTSSITWASYDASARHSAPSSFAKSRARESAPFTCDIPYRQTGSPQQQPARSPGVAHAREGDSMTSFVVDSFTHFVMMD